MSDASRKAFSDVEKLGGIATIGGEPSDRRVVAVVLRGAKVTDAALECITGLESLRELRLEDTRVGDSGLRHLAKLNRLRSLDLSGATVRGPGLDYLKGLVELERLSLYGTNIDAAGAAQLSGLKNIQELYLAHCKVTDAGVKRVAELKKLRSLTLFFCTGVTRNACSEVGTLAALESLDLSGTEVLATDLGFLRTLPRLRSLILFAVATDAGMERVKAAKDLRVLRIALSRVTDAGLKHIEALQKLEILDASETKITDVGLKCLKRLTQLRELWLTDTSITDEGLPDLAGLTGLRRLMLPAGNKVTDGGVAKLQRALPKCYITRGHPGQGFGGIAAVEKENSLKTHFLQGVGRVLFRAAESGPARADP